METAYFAGGCFWCITPTFQEMVGVRRVISGYSGGSEIAPSYEDVKYQRTGHRETICIEYNENRVSFGQLLDAFLENVDPFDEGGQFVDRGHSYTLAVYYRTQLEEDAARKAIAQLEEKSGRKAFVAVEPFKSFYAAEEEHQDYYRKNPEAFRKELIESGRIKL